MTRTAKTGTAKTGTEKTGAAKPGAAKPFTTVFSLRSRVVGTVALGFLLIGACGGWAYQAKLNGAVIAQGRVVVKSQVKKIQHPDGGIVGEILVENGSHVEAGEVLIRLDATQIRSQIGVLSSQLDELQGRQARLIAIRDDLPEIAFPPGFAEAPATADIAKGEVRFFEHDRAKRAVQRDQLASQADQYVEQIHGLEAQRQSNQRERDIVVSDDDRIQKLIKQGLVEQTKVSLLQRDMAKIDGLRGEIASNIARANAQIGETKLRILEIDHQAQTSAQQELREIDAHMAELNERLVAARDTLSRTDLRAPISGMVNDLSVHTVNGVIAKGETVMSIVPVGEMIVEARLSTNDIDQVAIGQSAKLRFSAFNRRSTPEIAGKVTVIGASSTIDPATGAPYYLSIVEISDASALGEHTLVPGMPVEVFFQTDERTALSYLMKPFSDQVERAFREE